MFGYTEDNGMEVFKEYTPLVIACMWVNCTLYNAWNKMVHKQKKSHYLYRKNYQTQIIVP